MSGWLRGQSGVNLSPVRNSLTSAHLQGNSTKQAAVIAIRM